MYPVISGHDTEEFGKLTYVKFNLNLKFNLKLYFFSGGWGSTQDLAPAPDFNLTVIYLGVNPRFGFSSGSVFGL